MKGKTAPKVEATRRPAAHPDEGNFDPEMSKIKPGNPVLLDTKIPAARLG